MKPELLIESIVVVGVFNPLEFDKYFFIKNKIASEEEIENGSLFLSEISQLLTRKFKLQITTVQLVISLIGQEDGLGLKILLQIAENGKITKLTNSGINFSWFINEKDLKSLAEFSKKIAYVGENKILKKYFNDDNAIFGFYSSKDVLNSRLKLDVKPVLYQGIESTEEKNAMQFNFNFHHDYRNEDFIEEFKKELSNYREFKDLSSQIVSECEI